MPPKGTLYRTPVCCSTRQIGTFRLHSPQCPAHTWVEKTPSPSVHAHNLRWQFQKRRAGAELTIVLTLLFALGISVGSLISWWIW